MRTATTRTIAGRVNADGTIAMAGAFTARRTAAGAYTLSFPGQRLLAVTVNSTGTASVSGYVTDGANVSTGADSAFGFAATVAA